jgi:hypothetical protein
MKTISTPKIIAALKPAYAERFQKALTVLERGLDDHHIWNADFNDAKDSLSRCMEQAMSVAAEPFYAQRRAEVAANRYSNDPRYDISGYMTYISAPKLLRRLEKANFDNPIISEYMEYLRELVQIGVLIKEVKHYIEKGRKPNVINKTPEELAAEIANTGICCICQRRQKLNAEQGMVHHGYEMSEYNHSGYRIGSCFGVKFLPYEFSCEANKQWLANVLNPQLKAQLKYLKELKNSVMPTLDRVHQVYTRTSLGKPEKVTETFAKGTWEYDEIREDKIWNTESNIRNLKSDIAGHTQLVKNWKLMPLKDGTVLGPKGADPKVIVLTSK